MSKNNFVTVGVSLMVAVLMLPNLFAQAANETDKPAVTPTQTAPAKSVIKRVLIVTGTGQHPWRETTPLLHQHLQKDERLDVSVSEDVNILARDTLKNYDVIVMNFDDPAVPGKEALKNLERFVENGGGLVIVHFACGAFHNFPEFVKLAGRVWNPKLPGHDPYGKYTVEIAKVNHPITQGLKAFETADELYTCLAGITPIEVLATAHSKVDGRDYPMALVLNYGRGRVFHCPLGHCKASFESPAVGELYRRGTAWVGQLEPVAMPLK